jgi:Ca2+-binding RTX toxin-like protein
MATIKGNSKANSLRGTSNNDTIYGYYGNDLLLGGLGNDVLYGGAGSDIVTGNGGNDKLYGGLGMDNLSGGAGSDRVFGEAGNDLITGQDGDDILDGGFGDDNISGGAGLDTIRGGRGADFMTGGTGADKFVFDDLELGRVNKPNDFITDFKSSQKDKIDLHLIDAIEGGADNAFLRSQISSADFTSTPVPEGELLRIIWDPHVKIINGGVGKMSVIQILPGGSILSSTITVDLPIYEIKVGFGTVITANDFIL